MVDRKRVIAIFDIGKTNKKVFLWDEDYKIVFEQHQNFDEIQDEDGFLGEDLPAVQAWMIAIFSKLMALSTYEICALNFSGYGATVVFVDANGLSITPLYNYLKQFPAGLFPYDSYGGQDEFARATASPILGNLNSGLQAFRVLKTKVDFESGARWVLHWPNFLSSIFTGQFISEITSIGCHTALWDFDTHAYHAWVNDFGLNYFLPTIKSADSNLLDLKFKIPTGPGLHDSSSALVPYLKAVQTPFLLISTGTWCISMHPFNASALTEVELKNDVLCFLQVNGKPVKAARLFAGNTHEIQTRRLENFFKVPAGFHKQISFESVYLTELNQAIHSIPSIFESNAEYLNECSFDTKDLEDFGSYTLAYVQLMIDLVCQQIFSLRLLLHQAPVPKILVDGGFSKNQLYMNFLVHAFPTVEIYGAEVAQASSLGAALVMHEAWNTKEIPNDLVQLKRF